MRQKTKKIFNGVKKIFLIFISIILILGFVYFSNNLEKVEPVKASPGSEHNVYGWAWAGGGEISGNATATIGWISFNSTNTGVSVNYGVNIKENGDLSGYAWAGGVAGGSASGTIGWIRFDPPPDFVTKNYPNCPTSTCPDGSPNYPARFSTSTKKITGWARACAATVDGDCNSTTTPGGWDGWILMGPIVKAGTDYGVWIDNSKEFRGWAWGGGDSTSTAVIGWISFNCSNQDVCATSSYKVMTTLILPPTVSELTSTFESPCYPGQSRIPKLSWTVSTEPPYDYYELQIASTTDPNFTSPLVDVKSSTSTNSTSWQPPCSGVCDVSPYNKILFGEYNYNWRVRVTDEGKTSNWATSSFTTLSHAYPYPDFTPSPLTGTVDQVITFINNSTCYGASCSYQWDFENDGVWDLTQATKQDATATYDKTGKKTVKLKITDNDLGKACEITREITIQAKLPWWREILPF